MTVEDVAERWGVSVWLVWRLAREGRIPKIEFGRRYRFRMASIEAWETAQEQGDDRHQQ